jgi:hypothetical protein
VSLPHSFRPFTNTPEARLEFAILVQCGFQPPQNIPAAMCDLLQVCLLFFAEFAIGEDDFDIEEENRETSDPVPSSESAVLRMVIRVAYSSKIALTWSGASIKSLRILLASSITVIKSPTLKPKLIVYQAQLCL